MAIIIMPQRISDNFGDGLNLFFELMAKIRSIPTEENIILDFSQSRFLTPFFLLPAFLFIRSERQKRVIEYHRNDNNYSFNQYLQFIHFDQGLKPEDFPNHNFSALMQQYSGKTYIPVVNFPARRSLDEDIRDKFMGCINQILKSQLNLSGALQTGIMYLIDEAVNNIIDHSCEERGFIFAQYYKANGYIDICIGDNGISLLGSYLATGNMEVQTDRDALNNAVKGVSTKNRPGAEGRGFGISTSLDMLVNGLKGKYFLLSGSSFFIKTLERQEIVALSSDFNWKGTIVALRIPYLTNPGFNPTNYYGS